MPGSIFISCFCGISAKITIKFYNCSFFGFILFSLHTFFQYVKGRLTAALIVNILCSINHNSCWFSFTFRVVSNSVPFSFRIPSFTRKVRKAKVPAWYRWVPHRHQPWAVLSPIRCKTLLNGGRRRTKNLYGVFKRTVPVGQVRQWPVPPPGWVWD